MRIVIPSVGYGDFLRDTLPAWRAFAPTADLRVVTAPDDVDTAAAAAGVGAELVTTDVWTKGGAIFNKAAALDLAIGRPMLGEVCITADADVVPFGRLPAEGLLQHDTIYGCARYFCPDRASLEAWRAGWLRDLALILPRQAGEEDALLAPAPTADQVRRAAGRALGYFQLFRWRPGRGYGSSTTAGGYDNQFARRFPYRLPLLGCSVLHLGAQDRRNWRGRVLPAWGAA